MRDLWKTGETLGKTKITSDIKLIEKSFNGVKKKTDDLKVTILDSYEASTWLFRIQKKNCI